jgi:hypothetical protein
MSTPAKTERDRNYGETDSNCVGTEISLSSSKKQKIEFEDQKLQLSETKTKNKNRVTIPLVVVSSHRKIMKLAHKQAKNQIRLESEKIDGSVWEKETISNASSSL